MRAEMSSEFLRCHHFGFTEIWLTLWANGKVQMFKRLSVLICFLCAFPVTAIGSTGLMPEIKFGTYLCELPKFSDGTKLEKCLKSNGDEYDCIGYKTYVSEGTMSTEGFPTEYKAISTTSENGKVIQIIYQMILEDGHRLDFQQIVSAIYERPNYINILNVNYQYLKFEQKDLVLGPTMSLSLCQFIK
jgi:hypothetical protein